jgi:PKD repeat protein
VVVTGLNLNYGTTYYFTVKAENGAGLMSGNTSSDGQTVTIPFNEPIASYNYSTTTICQSGVINFTNNSTDATTYAWSFPGGNPSTSSLANPSVQYSSSGTFTAELIATGPGGDDTLIQTLNITVEIPPVASFSASADTVYLPIGFVGFTNNSLNADGYAWNFGDGNTSNNANPWNQYTQEGVYSVELIAVNSSCENDTMNLNVVVLDITGVNEIYQEELLIFPNPTNEMLWVKSKKGIISIYDAAGKLVYSTVVNSEITSLDLIGISAGMYFVELTNESGVVREKFLKR